MKTTYAILVAVGVLALMLACSLTRFENIDPFYSSTGDWDSSRFPLLKPYEAIRLVGMDEWYINLNATDMQAMFLYASIPNPSKIAVQEGVIMVYTSYKPEVSENLRDEIFHWFVLIPSKDIEMGFKNETDFTSYIQTYGIDEVSWETPDAFFQEFEDTGCLEWIPGCEKR